MKEHGPLPGMTAVSEGRQNNLSWMLSRLSRAEADPFRAGTPSHEVLEHEKVRMQKRRGCAGRERHC